MKVWNGPEAGLGNERVQRRRVVEELSDARGGQHQWHS